MHYYPFNIGDYRRDCQHLTPLEHGIYRLLLDQFYLTEKPIDANALRLLCIRSVNELDIAYSILREFFVEVSPGSFINKRASKEIEKFQEKSRKATDSADKRWSNANAMRTHSKGNANHKPRTINQEPLTKNHKPIIKPSTANDKISFDGTTWQNITGSLERWGKAYPAININIELEKAADWLIANPANKKNNYARFLTNWFSRAQDRAPRINGGQSQPKPQGKADKFNEAMKKMQDKIYGDKNERDITAVTRSKSTRLNSSHQ